MDNEKLLDTILKDPAFSDGIAVKKHIKPREGNFVPFPNDLDERIANALRERNITRIYSHQGEVWKQVQDGKNVVVVTPTASGKTLCYNLPVMQTLLQNEHARALYLFPTKALSQDQQSELNELVGSSREQLPVKICTYDGDTPESLRTAARDSGRIIISNPDMLHAGVLPNHPKWIKFFSNLKYIVIDEAHMYRGVFGSHVANVIRRLKRIAAFYGSQPRFILCSATIGNPKELAESLIGEDVALVDNNGAPGGEKIVVLYNPPLVDAVQGIRKSSVTESRRWMLAFLKAGIKTILFAHSRIKTEVAASYVNEDLKNLYTENQHIKVEAYRGGLLPNERREIEKGLREGSIQGVVSTNALELGIDIGGLDASIVAGFPGSFNSFWQQSGRAGRRGGVSISVFIATSSPLDQFIIQNPEWFFGVSSEEGRLDPQNPYILTDHVKCAAFELPFRDETIAKGEDSFGKNIDDVLSFLEEDGILRHTGGRWFWANQSYPAEGISLRSAVADNVVIIDITQGRNKVIGEMDRPSAKEMIFKNAVYIHRGRQYLVESLDIENRKCLVTEADVNYFTDGLVKTDIKVLSEDEQFVLAKDDESSPLCKSVLGDVLVRTQVTKFKKLRFHTHENIGFGMIELPEEEIQTRTLTFLFSPETAAGKVLAEYDEEGMASILSGTGTLMKKIAPLYLLCDPKDLGTAPRVRDPHFGQPALYLYDRYPGGTGLAESLMAHAEKLFQTIYHVVNDCPCKDGCPSCVGAGEHKEGVKVFLHSLNGTAD
ncbi:MAG: DEAD/DEAH box helicase [Treponema sp.]|jgi:DEAD/DEAH box helicase domain-containing protein|nr:DEAD/DEAH box helicase [Treponema sp.]